MVNFIPAQLPSLARSAAAQMCGEGREQEGSVCAGSAQACGRRSPASPELRALWPVPPQTPVPGSGRAGTPRPVPAGLSRSTPAPALPASASGKEAPALELGDQPYPGDTHSVWTLLAVQNLIS